jgi:hypothetical protein
VEVISFHYLDMRVTLNFIKMDGSRWRKGRPLGISAMKLAKDKVILPLKFREKCKIFLTSAFSSDYAEERKEEGVALSIRAMKVTKGKQIFLLQPSCQIMQGERKGRG